MPKDDATVIIRCTTVDAYRQSVVQRLEAMGARQVELAHEMRVHPSTVNVWLRGHHSPSFESVIRLERGLRALELQHLNEEVANG